MLEKFFGQNVFIKKLINVGTFVYCSLQREKRTRCVKYRKRRDML